MHLYSYFEDQMYQKFLKSYSHDIGVIVAPLALPL